MKKLLKYLPLFLIFAVSCNEAQLPEYQNEPGLYFYKSWDLTARDVQHDSVSFMFFAKGVTTGGEYLQEIDVRTIGLPENRARKFKLEQANKGAADAAVPGVHYVAFDDPRMEQYLTVPANAVSHIFPVICINNSSLNEKQVRLEIKIVDNENFVPGIQSQSTFVVNFTDLVVRPNTWIDNQATLNWWPWFGDWSAVKMRFISITLGFVDFDKEYDPTKSYFTFYARKMYRVLREYNEAHPDDPMKDENGKLVTFPDKYAN